MIAPPNDPARLRAVLYGGDIVLGPPTPASTALVDLVWPWVDEAFADVGGARAGPAALDPLEVFRRVGGLRRRVFESTAVHGAVAATLVALGLDPDAHRFDPPKLRVVLSDGHQNPRARALYAAHRDTWYGHPQAIVTWWVPLHDVLEDETFVFYPERFVRPVANDSAAFVPETWSHELRIGWQDPDAGLRETYPAVQDQPAFGRPVGFTCRRGANLLFSGAQLHQTLPQSKGTARFSLDFRIAHVDDCLAGRGAPNADDRSGDGAFASYYAFPPRE